MLSNWLLPYDIYSFFFHSVARLKITETRLNLIQFFYPRPSVDEKPVILCVCVPATLNALTRHLSFDQTHNHPTLNYKHRDPEFG